MNCKFPGGHVEYSFEMYVDYREPIRCKLDDFRVNEIIISKLVSDDPFDCKWKLVVICSEVSSIEEVDSIGAENKENIFNLISFTLKTGVHNVRKTGHGLMPKKGEGAQCHTISPVATCKGIGQSGGRKLDAAEIHELEDIIVRSKIINNNSLVSIFSYATRVDEPVVQFMFLYFILYEIYKNQSSIDNFIMKISPNTVQLPSPHNKKQETKLETIFTKLRNDITHRIDTSREEINNGIICNVNSLMEIAHLAIMSQITQKK